MGQNSAKEEPKGLASTGSNHAAMTRASPKTQKQGRSEHSFGASSNFHTHSSEKQNANSRFKVPFSKNDEQINDKSYLFGKYHVGKDYILCDLSSDSHGKPGKVDPGEQGSNITVPLRHSSHVIPSDIEWKNVETLSSRDRYTPAYQMNKSNEKTTNNLSSSKVDTSESKLETRIPSIISRKSLEGKRSEIAMDWEPGESDNNLHQPDKQESRIFKKDEKQSEKPCDVIKEIKEKLPRNPQNSIGDTYLKRLRAKTDNSVGERRIVDEKMCLNPTNNDKASIDLKFSVKNADEEGASGKSRSTEYFRSSENHFQVRSQIYQVRNENEVDSTEKRREINSEKDDNTVLQSAMKPKIQKDHPSNYLLVSECVTGSEKKHSELEVSGLVSYPKQFIKHHRKLTKSEKPEEGGILCKRNSNELKSLSPYFYGNESFQTEMPLDKSFYETQNKSLLKETQNRRDIEACITGFKDLGMPLQSKNLVSAPVVRVKEKPIGNIYNCEDKKSKDSQIKRCTSGGDLYISKDIIPQDHLNTRRDGFQTFKSDTEESKFQKKRIASDHEHSENSLLQRASTQNKIKVNEIPEKTAEDAKKTCINHLDENEPSTPKFGNFVRETNVLESKHKLDNSCEMKKEINRENMAEEFSRCSSVIKQIDHVTIDLKSNALSAQKEDVFKKDSGESKSELHTITQRISQHTCTSALKTNHLEVIREKDLIVQQHARIQKQKTSHDDEQTQLTVVSSTTPSQQQLLPGKIMAKETRDEDCSHSIYSKKTEKPSSSFQGEIQMNVRNDPTYDKKTTAEENITSKPEPKLIRLPDERRYEPKEVKFIPTGDKSNNKTQKKKKINGENMDVSNAKCSAMFKKEVPVVAQHSSTLKVQMSDDHTKAKPPPLTYKITPQSQLVPEKVIVEEISKDDKSAKCVTSKKIETRNRVSKGDTKKMKKFKSLKTEEIGRKSGNLKNMPAREPTNALIKSADREKCEPQEGTVSYILTVLKELQDENDLFCSLIGIIVDIKFRVHSLTRDSKSQTTVVVIHFRSNADGKKFQKCMRDNNQRLSFKYRIQKEITIIEECKIDIKTTQRIQTKAEECLGFHQEKKRDTERKLSSLCCKSSKKKHVSLSFYEQREAEKKALADKIEELRQQQDEFQLCLSNIIEEIALSIGKIIKKKELDALKNRFDIECSRLREALPIYARKTEIINTVVQSQVSIVLGETGSGKSTQITQYILESNLSSSGKIICTQPRKVAAMSLAQRVASELNSNVGDLVGYQVGMKSKLSSNTRVLYMTDHMLLNECLKDPLLKNFSCVIIDEAHERSVYTDLLLGMIKKCLPHRPDLRVVITSATIDPDVFVQYFGGPEICPVLKVSGRMFPVEIEWMKMSAGTEVVDEYEIKAIEKAADIHRREPPGDILVFLTSQVEIEQCAEKLEILLRGKKDYWILPLHGKLQTDEQNLVFKVTPKARRKIVLATNVAETSVTIPGIRYVVDTGAVKELSYDPRKKVSSLRVVQVTQSSANQRKGRAGRTGPGKCYRLYSQDDYEMMCPTSIPEIQKIHLGHAILKLLQLDVDPLEFDFVQAPEKVSMENAFQHLSNLGAIENGKISPLGKWIAKLPFEPNLGVLVHDSIDRSVGVEGIIIAASCTVSGSLFYRGGTKDQKETSDKLKVQFCHKHGDHFTNLCVYKEWHRVNEKHKGKWCRDNSINGKAMRSIRDCTNEILHILRKDLDISIKFEFADSSEMERVLQKLLFRSFQNNLCHFLGHEKAGYHFIDKNQQVIMHPSSAFQSLASFPNWVIVERVMQTSRDFALNITAVADEDVEEALNDGSLDFDIEDVKRRKVTPVLTEYVGLQGHREFVGPRYSKVRAMQENLSGQCKDSVFVIDADRDKGEISIFAPIGDRDISSQTLKTAIDPIREKIKSESAELPVIPEFQKVRIAIGAGGQIQDLLYQDEYKNVFIFGEPLESYNEMLDFFGRFGSILSFIPKSPKNTNPNYIGQIIYERADSAQTAVTATRKRQSDFNAKPPKGIGRSEEGDLLKARLTWCRRRSRGFGFVQMQSQDKVDEIVLSCLLRKVNVGGKYVTIKRGKNQRIPDEKKSELFVSGLGELVNEDVLRESILNNFNVTEDDIGKVVVVREKTNTTPDMLSTLKTRLEVSFKKYLKPNMFFVSIVEPKPADFTYRAFVTFKDPEKGFDVCSMLRNQLFIGEHAVSITPEINSRLFVLAPVYKRVENDIERYCAKIQKEDCGRQITVRHLKNENYVIDIDADSIESMVHTRNKIQKMLEGETLDLEQIPALRYLFTRDGQEKVGRVMQKTKTLILLDHRNTSVSIHGKIKERELALRKIQKYVEKLSSSKLRIYDLKGETKPPGLMKAVIMMHGADLKGLKDLSELSAIELDHRNHRIKMLGSDDAVAKAVEDIDGMVNHLREKCSMSALNQPECGVCLCEIAETEMYRLESCGHPYCKDCIKMNIESTMQSKEFPLKCYHDGCQMLWAWKDFINMTKSGFCSLQNIISSSVSSYVRENKDKARYCITPDCPMVYKVTEKGGRIVCDVCRTGMCSKCHVEYHNGMSCAMYQMENGNDASGLREWMRRDPGNRKLCPNCFAGIEKNGGCQHMECRDCKKHICWTCMKFFDSGRECYGHMDREHGSFV